MNKYLINSTGKVYLMAKADGENLLVFTSGFWGNQLNYRFFNILRNRLNRNKDSKDLSTNTLLVMCVGKLIIHIFFSVHPN